MIAALLARPAVAVGLAGLLASAGAGLWGYGQGRADGRAAERADRALADQVATQATMDALSELVEQVQEQTRRGDALVAALQHVRQTERVVYRTIEKEIPHVARRNPCRFGADFVWLWNAALAPTAANRGWPLPDASGGTAAAPAAAGTVDTGRLLDNHTVNAERWSDCRRQLDALIDWHRQEGR